MPLLARSPSELVDEPQHHRRGNGVLSELVLPSTVPPLVPFRPRVRKRSGPGVMGKGRAGSPRAGCFPLAELNVLPSRHVPTLSKKGK
jgi:hypothetical protein